MDWKILDKESDFDTLIKTSFDQVAIIFKHSTRCGISSFVLRRFERDMDDFNSELNFYFLNLIGHRSISNLIEEKLNVRHESPQVMIVKDGKSIYNVSHSSIDFKTIIDTVPESAES